MNYDKDSDSMCRNVRQTKKQKKVVINVIQEFPRSSQKWHNWHPVRGRMITVVLPWTSYLLCPWFY